MHLWHSVSAGTICFLAFYDLVCPQHMHMHSRHRVPCFMLAHGAGTRVRRRRGRRRGGEGGVGDADGRGFDDGFACHDGPTAGAG